MENSFVPVETTIVEIRSEGFERTLTTIANDTLAQYEPDGWRLRTFQPNHAGTRAWMIFDRTTPESGR